MRPACGWFGLAQYAAFVLWFWASSNSGVDSRSSVESLGRFAVERFSRDRYPKAVYNQISLCSSSPALEEAPLLVDTDGSSTRPRRAAVRRPPHLDACRTHGDEFDVDSVVGVASSRPQARS